MGKFKDNPAKPFEVSVPNKIRKRIAMHEKDKPEQRIIHLSNKRNVEAMLETAKRMRGSMWSRFTSKVKNLFGGQNG